MRSGAAARRQHRPPKTMLAVRGARPPRAERARKRRPRARASTPRSRRSPARSRKRSPVRRGSVRPRRSPGRTSSSFPARPFLKGGRAEFAPFAGLTVNDNLIRHYVFGARLQLLPDRRAVGRAAGSVLRQAADHAGGARRPAVQPHVDDEPLPLRRHVQHGLRSRLREVRAGSTARSSTGRSGRRSASARRSPRSSPVTPRNRTGLSRTRR